LGSDQHAGNDALSQSSQGAPLRLFGVRITQGISDAGLAGLQRASREAELSFAQSL